MTIVRATVGVKRCRHLEQLACMVLCFLGFGGCEADVHPDPWARLERIELDSLLAHDPLDDRFQDGITIMSGLHSSTYGVGVTDSVHVFVHDRSIRQVKKISNGVPNGFHLEFYSDGRPYLIGSSTNGHSDGVSRHFDHAGNIVEIVFLLDGKVLCQYESEHLDSLFARTKESIP